MGRQWKLNLETGRQFLTNSKATERHVTESQGSLDLWAKEQELMDKFKIAPIVEALNRSIRDEFSYVGIGLSPDNPVELFVEARDDGLYLCDDDTDIQLEDVQGMLDGGIEQAVRDWISLHVSVAAGPDT